MRRHLPGGSLGLAGEKMFSLRFWDDLRQPQCREKGFSLEKVFLSLDIDNADELRREVVLTGRAPVRA